MVRGASRAAHQRFAAAAAVLLLAVSISAATASAAAAADKPARRLKQVTFFYDTPAAAGSTSADVNGNAAIRPDGTIHAALGGSLTSANAVANPILAALTGGAYKNRPKAATSAYTQIPLLLQQTLFPTLSYGLAEGSGDALSTSNGAWGSAELGYNPISNNLGASASAGSANSVNVDSAEELGSLNPGAGKSGIEFAGTANDETNVADARSAQTGQAVAGPNSLATPFNPLTCTQALLYGVTLTSYDLGAPVGPLPDEASASIIPFCLTLFNFASLGDFANMIDGEQGAPFNPQGAGVTATELTAPPVGGATGNVFSDGTLSPGLPFPTTGAAAGRQAGQPRAGIAPSDNRNAELRQQAAALGLVGQQREGAAASEPAPGAGSAALKGAYDNSPGNGKKLGPVRSFSDAVNEALKTSSPEIKAFAETPFGQEMLSQITDGSLGRFVDGADKILRSASDAAIQAYAEPVRNFTMALSNFTSGAVKNATNLGLKAAVAGMETLEPAIKLGVGLNNNVYQPAAKASKEAAARLQAESQAKLMDSISKMPAGKEQQQLLQGVQKLNRPAVTGERRRSLLSLFKLW